MKNIFRIKLNFYTFLVAFGLFNLGYLSQFFFIPLIVAKIIQFLAIIFLSFFLLKNDNVNITLYGKIAYYLFVIWNVYLIFVNGFDSFQHFQRNLFLPLGFSLFLMPIFVKPFSKLANLPSLFKFIHYLNLIYLFMIFIFGFYIIKKSSGDDFQQGYARNLFETLNFVLAGGAFFLIFVKQYVTKWQYNIANIVCITNVIFGAILARRSLLLSYIIAYIFNYFLSIYMKKKLAQKFKFIFFVSIIFTFIILFISNYGQQYFPKLYNRISDDTRTLAEYDFIVDITSGNDYIFGRGISGTYKSYYVDDQQNREGIETGYLQLLLKGGIVLDVLFVLFFFPAILLGIFFSKNILCKVFGIYGLMFILNFIMASSNYSFMIRFLIMLMGTFLCYNNKVRNMNESEILKLVKRS